MKQLPTVVTQFLEFYRSNEASVHVRLYSVVDSLVTWEESSGSHGESCSTFELIRDNSDSGHSRWRQRATPPFTRRSCSIVSVSTATWIFLHSSELPGKRIHQPPPPLREDSFGNVSRAVPIAKASAAERQRRKWGGAGERWLAKRRKKEEAKEEEEDDEEEEEGESRLSKRGQKDSSEIKNSQGGKFQFVASRRTIFRREISTNRLTGLVSHHISSSENEQGRKEESRDSSTASPP
ncbi:hypothetical protein WN51_12028 [Melipona quadrifasciata]|uniref:Uncharacterized protein n=1 Tax=Melipona quadrifasciata TaxID=166423 RepID=A0A0N0U632_9HYME|nr:hypothetical protein WN51_12028 [Melipona quadrifasciata]